MRGGPLTDSTDEFARLTRLHLQGALSDAEYAREKAVLMELNPSASGTTPAPSPYTHPPERSKPWLWFGLSAAVILIIGAYFLGKGATLAEQRGELAGPTSAGIDNGVAQLCLLAPFMKLESLNHTAGELAAQAKAAGRTVTWDATTDGAILHLHWNDPLEGRDHELSVELVRMLNAVPQTSCVDATAGAAARRIMIDGKILEGLAVGVSLQQAFAQPGATAAASPSSAANYPAPIESEAPPAETATPTYNATQNRLIDRHANLESQCRADPPGQENKACEKRDQAIDDLIAAGLCWGREDQFNAEYEYHICRPGSIGYQSSPQARHRGH